MLIDKVINGILVLRELFYKERTKDDLLGNSNCKAYADYIYITLLLYVT